MILPVSTESWFPPDILSFCLLVERRKKKRMIGWAIASSVITISSMDIVKRMKFFLGSVCYRGRVCICMFIELNVDACMLCFAEKSMLVYYIHVFCGHAGKIFAWTTAYSSTQLHMDKIDIHVFFVSAI